MSRLGHTMTMSGSPGRWGEESVPPSPSPERPPFAPHDPPEPAPQAAAWERALRVIFMESAHGIEGVSKNRSWRTNKRGRAAIKAPRNH
jgi:hypothetical protein